MLIFWPFFGYLGPFFGYLGYFSATWGHFWLLGAIFRLLGEGDASNSLSSSDPIIYGNHNTLYSINWNKNKGENIFIDGSDIKFRMTEPNIDIDQKYLGALAAKRIIQCNTRTRYYSCVHHARRNTIGGLFTKEKLVDLAVKFNIITQHTSMIAVDKNSDHINDSLHNISKNDDLDDPHNSIHPSLAGLFLPKFDQLLFKDITSDPNDVSGSPKDKATDYLFDYFMNEDKFNEQRASLTGTNTPNTFATPIFTKKDYYTHSIPQRPCCTKQNLVQTRNTENLCNMLKNISDIIKDDHIQTCNAEYLYNMLENISDETITIIKNQNTDKIFYHFDFRVGLFKKSVCEDIVDLDKINEFVAVKNDRYALTVLILYFSHKIWLCDNFQAYFGDAMCNDIFAELINNKKYNLAKFFK